MPYAAVNGLNMYYEDHGEGPALLLLHGGSGSIPEKWIPFFSPPFRVIAMEQMGHGRTADVTERPFHYHDMAEDTVELMRQLGIARAAIVGYSDGGIIGLDMAIHHPGRVTKLAITGACADAEHRRRRRHRHARARGRDVQDDPRCAAVRGSGCRPRRHAKGDGCDVPSERSERRHVAVSHMRWRC
ncbi:MAG: alpha/beta hydrolase [Gaiellaceae bacterium]